MKCPECTGEMEDTGRMMECQKCSFAVLSGASMLYHGMGF